jgi:hypothetical protein
MGQQQSLTTTLADYAFDLITKLPIVERRVIACTAEDIKPMNADDWGALERAVHEMRACKDIFASWRQTLDRYAFPLRLAR